jgi:hypothetical protein
LVLLGFFFPSRWSGSPLYSTHNPRGCVIKTWQDSLLQLNYYIITRRIMGPHWPNIRGPLTRTRVFSPNVWEREREIHSLNGHDPYRWWWKNRMCWNGIFCLVSSLLWRICFCFPGGAPWIRETLRFYNRGGSFSFLKGNQKG